MFIHDLKTYFCAFLISSQDNKTHLLFWDPFSVGLQSRCNDFDVLLLLKTFYFHSLHPAINKFFDGYTCHCSVELKIRWLIISQRPLINTINLPFDINLELVKTVKKHFSSTITTTSTNLCCTWIMFKFCLFKSFLKLMWF